MSPLTITGTADGRLRPPRPRASLPSVVELLPRAGMHRDGRRPSASAAAMRSPARSSSPRPSPAASSSVTGPRRVTVAAISRSAMRHVAHQRRAGLPARHFLGRTAHVDVEMSAPAASAIARPAPSSALRSRRAAPRADLPAVRLRRAGARCAFLRRAPRRRSSRKSPGRRPSPTTMRRNGASVTPGHRRQQNAIRQRHRADQDICVQFRHCSRVAQIVHSLGVFLSM